MTAEDVYEECLYNVVEVKAVSESVGESFGTAVLISLEGRFVTNAHVVTYSRLNLVNEFENYSVRFSYEEEYRAVTLEKYDTEKDIAVLKLNDITGLDLKPIKLGDASGLKAGEKVYAVGKASNYGVGIFGGMVSIPLINIELDGNVRSVIQCDLTIAAGNSGGALLNGSGELIGITTFRIKDNSGNVIYGIVYSIPVNMVRAYLG
ncbi:MAG: serine protease [Clostridia bacterium]|nr:serine protease [Clostridia bacterium]